MPKTGLVTNNLDKNDPDNAYPQSIDEKKEAPRMRGFKVLKSAFKGFILL